jgi:hypothetical protein
MTRNPATAATKLALLIDGDNISATYMPLIMREAEKRGTVAIRRIYGQFKSGKMKSWMKHIEDFDLIAVNVSPLTRGKNATDMKLTIEAMDMLSGRQLDGVCIASSDGDFTPLAARIRASALAVFGFGTKKAPQGYKDEFDRFYECDTLLAAEKAEQKQQQKAERKPAATPKTPAAPAPARRPRQAPARKASAPAVAATTPAATAPAPPPKEGKPEIPAAQVLAAIDAVAEGRGRAHMRDVGNRLMRAIPGFSAKTYGYRTIGDLVRALPGLEFAKVGNETYVRRS